MVTKRDLVACYPLVAAYVQNPAAANSVTELIIDLPSRRRPYTELNPTPPATRGAFVSRIRR